MRNVRNLFFLVMGIVFVVLPLIVYKNYKSAYVTEDIQSRTGHRAIDAKGLYVSRYRKDNLTSELFSDIAFYVNPGTVNLSGSVRLFRYSEGQIDTSSSNSLAIDLKTQSVAELIGSLGIDHVKQMVFDGNVVMKSNQGKLESDRVLYTPDDGFISSIKPSTITTKGSQTVSENGFVMNLRTGDMRMRGPVKGVYAK